MSGIMIEGTEGATDYLVFARKGPIALAIKPVAFTAHPGICPKGFMAIHCRVRSANAKSELAELDEGNIAKPGFTNLTTSWPNAQFEKVNEERASLNLFYAVEGDLSVDGIQYEQNLHSSMAVKGIVNAIMHMAEGGEVLLTEAEISEHLMSKFQPVINSAKHHQAIMAAIQRFVGNKKGEAYTSGEVNAMLKEKFPPEQQEEVEGLPEDLPKHLH